MIVKSIKRYFLILFGSLSLVLGIIGILIPILPATPFLLLSSLCYIRSSSRLYYWLMSHKILGPYIYNYLKFRAMTKSAKVGALLFLWLTLTISIFIASNIYLKTFLLVVGIGVSAHLISLKTLKEESIDIVEEYKTDSSE